MRLSEVDVDVAATSGFQPVLDVQVAAGVEAHRLGPGLGGLVEPAVGIVLAAVLFSDPPPLLKDQPHVLVAGRLIGVLVQGSAVREKPFRSHP